MSRRLPTVGIYFWFHGDSFDPEEITRRLGIEPTKSFKPGDPITMDGQGRRLGYGWMVRVGGCEAIDIDDILAELQARIDVPPARIKQLCNDLHVKPAIVCGVDQHELAVATPNLFFPPDFLGWVAEIGASLEVDVIL